MSLELVYCFLAYPVSGERERALSLLAQLGPPAAADPLLVAMSGLRLTLAVIFLLVWVVGVRVAHSSGCFRVKHGRS